MRQLILNVTLLEKNAKIRRDASCNSKNVIYVAYCIKCMKQGVGWTTSWKLRLSNYKSHVKKKELAWRIVKHFIENCNNNGFNNLRFTIVDCLYNEEDLTGDEIDDHFLKKEKFWIRTLVTQHHGLNSKHDLKRKKAMWAWKVKPLDIENSYMYHKKTQYVENFNDCLIMIFLNIVFQTSYEKCFIVKREYWFENVSEVFRFSMVLFEKFCCFFGLSQDLGFVVYFSWMN